MKIKLRLELTGSGVRALNAYVSASLTRYPLSQVQSDLYFYMAMASLYEVYGKTNKLVENINLFPTRRTDETYRLTFTRTQCLALAGVYSDDDTTRDENALQTYEVTFMMSLMGQIHQTFLI